MNTMISENGYRELTLDELDMVEGASAEGIAASTSAVGGMTAVHGLYEITDYVLGMAAGAVLAGK